MIRLLTLTSRDVERALTMKETISVVENAFKAMVRGDIRMSQEKYIDVPKHTGKFGSYLAISDRAEVWASKVASNYPDNPVRDCLPSVMGIVTLFDARTGKPLAIMDGATITAMRTGAVGGIGAKYLARKDSSVAGIIGCGAQGRTQLMALGEVLKLNEVRAYDPVEKLRRKYVLEMSAKLEIPVKAVNDAKECVVDADIVVTATSSKKPVVMNDWVKEQMHITSIAGVHELEAAIYRRAKVVLETKAALHLPQARSYLRESQIYALLEEIIAGKKRGRETRDEITVLSTHGLAVSDLAAASAAYRLAKRKGLGSEVEL